MKSYKNFFLIFSLNIFILNNVFAQVDNSVVLNNKVAPKLSDYGFFEDLNAQIPTKGVLPYELITPLFSDYADKLRFIYMPEGGFAEFIPNKVFDFPDGTVLIKTFAYLNDHEESNLDKQLLETRLLIKKKGQWKNVSYVWNQEQSDAFLTIAGKTIPTQFVNQDGDMQEVRYRVPNINQCKECHQSDKSIKPIGPKARNLNKNLVLLYTGLERTAHEIAKSFIHKLTSFTALAFKTTFTTASKYFNHSISIICVVKFNYLT